MGPGSRSTPPVYTRGTGTNFGRRHQGPRSGPLRAGSYQQTPSGHSVYKPGTGTNFGRREKPPPIEEEKPPLTKEEQFRDLYLKDHPEVVKPSQPPKSDPMQEFLRGLQ